MAATIWAASPPAPLLQNDEGGGGGGGVVGAGAGAGAGAEPPPEKWAGAAGAGAGGAVVVGGVVVEVVDVVVEVVEVVVLEAWLPPCPADSVDAASRPLKSDVEATVPAAASPRSPVTANARNLALLMSLSLPISAHRFDRSPTGRP